MTKKEKRRKKEEVGEFLLLSTGVVHVGEKPSPFTRHMPDDNWYKCYSRRGVLAFSFHTHPIFTDSLFYAESSRRGSLCSAGSEEEKILSSRCFVSYDSRGASQEGGKMQKGCSKGWEEKRMEWSWMRAFERI